ncbi:hypothetical protein [Peribacillus asahii]|uniref:hypothetical protein n=1 Tax=Peribacillus asahii TaxID=228899 RepID=UPI0020796C0C|nr:hypothetical protein [Peribacillus asahii]USK72698.1 hypothetical protein LIS76_23915 [Peribacillus asahii]
MKYTALEEIDFLWEPDEIKRFEQLWNDGVDIIELSIMLNRSEVEVAILIMDRHMQGGITEREFGVFGGKCVGRKLRKPRKVV